MREYKLVIHIYFIGCLHKNLDEKYQNGNDCLLVMEALLLRPLRVGTLWVAEDLDPAVGYNIIFVHVQVYF